MRKKDYGTDTVIVWDGLPIMNYATGVHDTAAVASAPTAAPTPTSSLASVLPPSPDDEAAPNIAEARPVAPCADIDKVIETVVQNSDVRKPVLHGNGIPWGVLVGRSKQSFRRAFSRTTTA